MINEKYIKAMIKKAHKYTFDSKSYMNVEDVKDLLFNAMYLQRKACAVAAKPFFVQHIVIQELRDLYTTKIISAEVDNEQ